MSQAAAQVFGQRLRFVSRTDPDLITELVNRFASASCIAGGITACQRYRRGFSCNVSAQKALFLDSCGAGDRCDSPLFGTLARYRRRTGSGGLRVKVAAADNLRTQRVIKVVAQGNPGGDVQPGDALVRHVVEVLDQGAQ
jgi:hypothetical protein